MRKEEKDERIEELEKRVRQLEDRPPLLMVLQPLVVKEVREVPIYTDWSWPQVPVVPWRVSCLS